MSKPADQWTIEASNGSTRTAESRSDAESTKADMEALGLDVAIHPPGEASGNGTEGVQVVEQPENESAENGAQALDDETENRLAELGESVQHDPLSILPDYMIDRVQGTPTLNKRGLSVLAYHYGVSIVGRDIRVSPHESDWEYAIVETTVENADGNTFVGSGTAHVDRGDDNDVLLELAETRSYKRAVSFATGVGIVSYQEMTGELED